LNGAQRTTQAKFTIKRCYNSPAFGIRFKPLLAGRFEIGLNIPSARPIISMPLGTELALLFEYPQ
jgi:hypothetical protein